MTRLLRCAALAAAFSAVAAPTLAAEGTTYVRNASECAGVHEVEITAVFTPAALTITQGECIHFTNIHNIEHSAVGEGREFNTGIMMPGGTALVRFDAPAEVPYICGVHPLMKATLTVTAAE